MCPSKTEDLNLSVFNIIIGINEQKTLSKYISSKCECKSDGIKCNSSQKWNNDKRQCECKNLKEHHMCKNTIFRILNHLQNIWDKLWFSCEIAHCEISSVLFLRRFLPTDKIFIFVFKQVSDNNLYQRKIKNRKKRGWRTENKAIFRQSFQIFLMFPNFSRP